MELKIATRCCRDQQDNPRLFHYYLTANLEEHPRFVCENYGVRIVEDGVDAVEIPSITNSAARIDQLLTLLVDNMVGPAGVRDVVSDWL